MKIQNFRDLLSGISGALYGTYKRMEDEHFSPRFAMQAAICMSLYKNPEANNDELLKQANRVFKNASLSEVYDILQDYELIKLEQRKQIISEAKKLIEDFFYVARDRNVTESISLTEEIRRIVFQRKFTTPDIKVRFMLLHLLELLKTEEDYKLNSNINRLSDQLIKMGDVYTRGLFVRIFDLLTDYCGYSKKVNLEETISKSKSDVTQLISVSDQPDQSNIFKEYLQMKDALVVVYEQLDSIRDDYLAYQEQGAQEAKKDFFTKLNSEEHNKLLDTLAISNHLLTGLLKSGWKAEPTEVQSVVLSIKGILKAFQSLGLSQTEKIGKKLTISSDDTKNYEYLGSEFKENEHKEVEVQTPGWKLGELIISQPKVKEIQGE